MATNPGLSFKKVASKPTSGMTQGEIYFVTDDKTIYVATSTTDLAPFYGGNVKNVTIKHKDNTSGKDLNYLTITLFEGNPNPIELDFSDIASMSNVDDLINALNIYGYTSGTDKYALFKDKAGWEMQFDGGEEYVYAEATDKETINLTSTYNGNVTVTGVDTPTKSSLNSTAANKQYVDAVSCKYETKSTDNKKYIVLYNSITSAELGSVDCTEFLKDKFLKGTAIGVANESGIVTVTIESKTYSVTGKTAGHTYIVFLWVTDTQTGVSLDALDVSDLIDVYTAGNGISISDANKISVKSGSTLKFDTDGTLQVAKTPGALGIILPGGTTSYDGSATKSVTIAPDTIGAATDDALDSLNIEYDDSGTVSTQPVYDGSKTTYLKGKVVFGKNANTTSAEYVIVTETTDANLKLVRVGNTTQVKVSGIATPTDNNDAANKSYVDSKMTWAAWS